MNNFTFAVIGMALLALTGCTALREADASGQEQLLAASGFQIRPANTPKRQAALAKMEPYKLHSHEKNGAIYYTYADPKKGLLYVGDSNEFAKYSGLLVKQTIANQQYWAATQYQMAPAMWDVWGPWGYSGATMPLRTMP